MEVLISFLILSSSFMAYTMLVARAELIQTQSNQSMKAVFMADYVLNQLALSAEVCNLNYHCLADKIELGVFDASSSLLEGYGWSTLGEINSKNSLGCIEYDSTLNFFTISIFHESQSLVGSTIADCDIRVGGHQSVVRYLLPSLSGKIFSE